jgi:hypothetical protein
MNTMIAIGNTLISEEILTECFCCNIQRCMGNCCIEGDAGAPLEKEEIQILEKTIEKIKPFMSKEGAESLVATGVYTFDFYKNLVTPLVNGKECVFTIFKKGIAYCAIEAAYETGEIDFQKPVSCHLYPIRISKFSDYEAVNIHKWSVCSDAWKEGKEKGIPVYKFLRKPLIRKYGEEWYNQLEVAAGIKDNQG